MLKQVTNVQILVIFSLFMWNINSSILCHSHDLCPRTSLVKLQHASAASSVALQKVSGSSEGEGPAAKTFCLESFLFFVPQQKRQQGQY